MQTDLDGATTWTNIVALNGLDIEGKSLVIVPNPSHGDLRLVQSEDLSGPITLRLIDTSGRVIFEDRVFYDNIELRVHLPSHIAEGRYTLLCEHANGQLAGKLFLVR